MAVEKKKVIGMVAYHRHSKSRCEMKRLYVKPKYRENKLGKKLVLEILEYAKKAGYKEMVLDTIIPLQSAIHLYKKVGFKEVGRIRKRQELMGKFYDCIVMDILNEEYESLYIKREIEKRYKL